jgi:site-specific DNA-cytosine methylase
VTEAVTDAEPIVKCVSQRSYPRWGKDEDRTQRLYIKEGDITNTISTVDKDNMILEAAPLNPMEDETCRLLKSQYFKNSTPNFESTGTWGATGVVETERGNRMDEWTWEINEETYRIRIRKLMPLETWRLMGFSDADFHKAEAVNSNTQLYKQAGNSIVVDCLEEIFKQML